MDIQIAIDIINSEIERIKRIQDGTQNGDSVLYLAQKIQTITEIKRSIETAVTMAQQSVPAPLDEHGEVPFKVAPKIEDLRPGEFVVRRRRDCSDNTFEVYTSDENYTVDVLPNQSPVCGCGKGNCLHIGRVLAYLDDIAQLARTEIKCPRCKDIRMARTSYGLWCPDCLHVVPNQPHPPVTPRALPRIVGPAQTIHERRMATAQPASPAPSGAGKPVKRLDAGNNHICANVKRQYNKNIYRTFLAQANDKGAEYALDWLLTHHVAEFARQSTREYLSRR